MTQADGTEPPASLQLNPRSDGVILPLRFSGIADRAVEAAAAILLMALLICVFLGVVFRQLNDPLAWSDELAQYLLVWTGFLGWVIAARRRAHIRVMVVAQMLPLGAQRILEVLTQLAIIVFAGLLTWFSFGLMNRTWDVESVSLPITAAGLYVVMPVAGLALIAQAIVEIVQVLSGAPPPGQASPEEVGII